MQFIYLSKTFESLRWVNCLSHFPSTESGPTVQNLYLRLWFVLRKIFFNWGININEIHYMMQNIYLSHCWWAHFLPILALYEHLESCGPYMCDASGTWASYLTGSLTSILHCIPPHTSVLRYITLCMSAQARFPRVYKPGQHSYLVLIFLAFLLTLAYSFLCVLAYYYSGYEPSFVTHNERLSYTSTLYPRSSSSLTCATLHRGHRPSSTLGAVS